MPNSFPVWIEPMAATLTQERFTGPEWSFERKFDGIRLLAYKKGKQVELFSRNHLPQNLPAVSQAIAKLKHDQLILDGEITWGRGQLTYHVFDIMWIDGREVMSLPLEERRRLLRELRLPPPMIQVDELNESESRLVGIATGSGNDYHDSPWEHARQAGWEGVIAKRRGSIYEPRRSRNWLKMKCELAQEFVVGGFTDPQGKRVGLGALLVGYYEYPSVSVPGADRGPHARSARGVVDATGSRDNPASNSAPVDFVFAGKIGTGFNTQLLLDLRAQLDELEIAKSPFTRSVGLPRVRAHWVQPRIVVQVGFIQWTGNNKLRHPRLLGLRRDKDPRDVVRE